MATKRPSGAVVFLLVGSLVATSSAQSIFEVLSSTPSLALLTAGISATGLVSTLSDPTLNVTLFAPSNEALLGVLTDLGVSLEGLLALGTSLTPVFQYHVVQTALNASEIPSGDTSLPTLAAGANLTITKSDANITVKSLGSDANVIQADLIAGGSRIHIIDRVLLPFFVSIASALSRSPALSTLLTAVQTANITAIFSDPLLTATVFAPSNLSVVLAGANVVVTPLSAITATVRIADIPIGLGPRSVVHVVDQLLLPFYSSVANAAQSSGLTTLLAVVAADGRFGAQLSDPKFVGTILAPTDAAFTALLTRMGLTAEQLLSDRATLASILELHILPGVSLKVAQLTSGPVTTLSAAPLLANITGNVVTFVAAQSTATVIAPDVSVNLDRAVVHVIDQVLCSVMGAAMLYTFTRV
ncbi:hypothetical protein TSOC_005467 [Tetrabaena socialis]|uniref:FAS1 domain-containing protein n=1 Tax=Tetrabaena socialis TaxID=47790 RepID=A0A2J8A6A3_9CHLO|nr:hypothetical protein TSOC_005467 [Tetrabaena socialis]|eukprot:PNH08030.1 hypothetical protein TSOC_005467 [Tetrabaena socialis]